MFCKFEHKKTESFGKVDKNVSNSMSKPSNVAFVCVLFMVAVVVVYWKDFSIERAIAFQYSALASSMVSPSILPSASPLQPPVKRLVEALRKATVKVEKKTGDSANTNFDFKQWRGENPCKSRTELGSFYSRLRYSPNRKTPGRPETSQWETVLLEYEKLHRVCTRAAGNLTEYFYARNTSTGCQFMIATATNGMGNKLFIMAPAVLYAILTQRVILLPESTGVPDLMCEPFSGSSWRLSTNIHNNDVSVWNQTREFMENVDRAKQKHESTLPMYASRIDDGWQPDSRFFCNVEQSYFTQVPWLCIHGCLYFLPKLFAISSFQTTLEALFPDPSLALTQILRTTFLPCDRTWNRVRTAKKYLDDAYTQVGIQARYFNNSESKHKVINANVESCIIENNLLEQAIPGETSKTHQTTIFIASLTSDLQQHLRNIYNRTTAFASETITFQQLSSAKEQRFGPDVYDQVLVEVLWLSLSHTLLVSPKSTFGGLAQAYGALTPWIIESRDDATTSCQLAQTVDNCYQIPELVYMCPYDAGGSKLGKAIVDMVPYVKTCLAIDNEWGGLQLVDGLKRTNPTAP